MDSPGGRDRRYSYLGSGNMLPHPDKCPTLWRYSQARSVQDYTSPSSTLRQGCTKHNHVKFGCVTCALKAERLKSGVPQESFCFGQENFLGSKSTRPFPDKYQRLEKFQEPATRQMYDATPTLPNTKFMPAIAKAARIKHAQARQEETLPLKRLKTGDNTFCIGERDLFYPFIGSNSLMPYPNKYMTMGRYQELAAQNQCGRDISPYQSPYAINCAKRERCPNVRRLQPKPSPLPLPAKPISAPCLKYPGLLCVTCAKQSPASSVINHSPASSFNKIPSWDAHRHPGVLDEKIGEENGPPWATSVIPPRTRLEAGDGKDVYWPERPPPRVSPPKKQPAVQPCLFYRQPLLDFMDRLTRMLRQQPGDWM